MIAARPARAEEAGRVCPYCRFALKAGAGVVDCGACRATHHADCWADNGGCAIVGCAGGPAAPGAGPAASAAPALATPSGPAAVSAAAPPAPPAAPPPAPPDPPRGSQRGLVMALIGLAVVVAGAGAAIAISQSGGSDPATTVVQTAPAEPSAQDGGTTGAAPAAETEPEPETTPGAPAEPSAEEQIQTVVGDYYAAVREGDYERAWALLSPTYKAWKSRPANGGKAKWLSQERRNHAHLVRTRPSVTVRENDPVSHVATIEVTGMRFRQSGGNICPYEGVTWARRVGGTWYYDQGYAQNETRRRKWRPRNRETLGYVCETDGY